MITIGEQILDGDELAVEPVAVEEVVRPAGSVLVETLHVHGPVLGLAVDGDVDDRDAFAAAEERVLDLHRPVVAWGEAEHDSKNTSRNDHGP